VTHTPTFCVSIGARRPLDHFETWIPAVAGMTTRGERVRRRAQTKERQSRTNVRMNKTSCRHADIPPA
jgi:hypothetical protein